MPSISAIVASYGLPPEMVFADAPNGSHLSFIYETGTLYFGPDSSRVVEIRLANDSASGFSLEGVSVGSPLSAVTAAFGDPDDTVYGETEFEDRVLYVNPDTGGYLKYESEGIRFFFSGSGESSLVVAAIYLF